MLEPFYQKLFPEAGCDEAGRGCLAGPVFAAAVILPADFSNPILNDSKKLNEKQRYALREIIQEEALAWAVQSVNQVEIDSINILNASIKAMHLAIGELKLIPKFIIVDGNRFKPVENIPHKTIVKGDGKYASIAAASILAKTYRDDFMQLASTTGTKTKDTLQLIIEKRYRHMEGASFTEIAFSSSLPKCK